MQPNQKPRSIDVELTHSNEHSTAQMHPSHNQSPYRNLLLMGLIHLPIMYAIMFTMVYSMREVVHNLNTFYMAGMMTAPMVIMMPVLMRKMYPSKKRNLAVYASASLIFVVLFVFMRNQSFVDDKQFLRSMIPHHSGAILMCERATLSDPEIINLCKKIIEGQKAEIDQMEQMLGKIST